VNNKAKRHTSMFTSRTAAHPLATLIASIVILSAMSALQGCGRQEQPTVIIYTALDRIFSEPILDEFERRTDIRVLAKYDTESTKTVGLVNAIRAERTNPRCDVFWNNEIVNTIRLKDEGLLQPFHPKAAENIPATFKDSDGYWCGFAARARVLLINTDIVKPSAEPDSIYSLADPQWKGRTGIAKPLFGTTATHASCLFSRLGEADAAKFFSSLKNNDIQIHSGNKGVANAVAIGRLAFGLTDTDDAIIAVEEINSHVKIVYPDSKASELGVLFIPNTISLIRNAPHTESGKKLIEYLLSPEVETALAEAKSAQIPLNPSVRAKVRVKTPAEVNPMDVDFAHAAKTFSKAASYIEENFLK
jgi:iron(III) transport system substrate-binding protein